MAHGIAVGQEPTREEEILLEQPALPTEPHGVRERAGMRRVMVGDRNLSINPSLALTEDGAEWVLKVECHWPADPQHVAEAFAIAALAVESLRAVLTGEDDLGIPADMLLHVPLNTEEEAEDGDESEL